MWPIAKCCGREEWFALEHGWLVCKWCRVRYRREFSR
jgi:hypothetical protein